MLKMLAVLRNAKLEVMANFQCVKESRVLIPIALWIKAIITKKNANVSLIVLAIAPLHVTMTSCVDLF